MTTYIAGPMSGYPEFNYPAFAAAAAELRAAGVEVVNPTAVSADVAPDAYTNEKPYDWYLRRSLRLLLDCDAILLLPGWEKSKGACLEYDVAWALGMRIDEYQPHKPTPAQHHPTPQEASSGT